MTDSTTNAETIVPGSGLGALVTTGLVSAIAAFSATLLYFHYFPPVVEKPAPIAVVDMVKLGMSVTQMSKEGDGECQDFCVWGGYSRGSPTRLPFVFCDAVCQT